MMYNKHLPYGYFIGDSGYPAIDEEKAVHIQKIFQLLIEGMSQDKIAKWLIANGAVKTSGSGVWTHSTIGHILKNSKYYGDEIYPAIITKDIFDKAAKVRAESNTYLNRNINYEQNHYKALYPFSGRIVCGTCGSRFRRCTENSGKVKKKHVWHCGRYIVNGRVQCKNGPLEEPVLEKLFTGAFQELYKNFDIILMKTKNPFTPPVNKVISLLDNKIKDACDDMAYIDDKEAKEALEDRIRTLLRQRTEEAWNASEINDFDFQTEKLKNEFLKISKVPEGFDGEIFKKVIKHVTLIKPGRVSFLFLNGITIEREYEIRKKGGVPNGKKHCSDPGKTCL